jgi:hypothetical protein
VPCHGLYRLLEFSTEGEAWEFVALEVSADAWKIRNFFRYTSSPVTGATELGVAFQ